MNIETVKQQLKAIKLFTAAQELEGVLSEQKKAVSLHWFSDLLEREIEARKEKSLLAESSGLSSPKSPPLRPLTGSLTPRSMKKGIRQLATLDFISQDRTCLFLGQPGTGKTHLALAIGLLAANQGYRVYCTGIKKLARDILQAKMKNSLDALFKKMLSSKLWILDDWGVITMTRDIAEEVFDLLDRRKHSSAMILTFNRDLDEWPQVFPDPALANATIDRIFDRADISLFKGKSYRVKGKISVKSVDLKSIKK